MDLFSSDSLQIWRLLCFVPSGSFPKVLYQSVFLVIFRFSLRVFSCNAIVKLEVEMNLSHSRLLFLCTGNYYRSRFAEYLFNHHVMEHALPWQAFSRGLAIEMLKEDAGPISPHALLGLVERGIHPGQIRSPIALTRQDLEDAQHIIALKQMEHRPLLANSFPEWAGQIEYWHVHDIEDVHPEQALPQIETHVQDLLQRLNS